MKKIICILLLCLFTGLCFCTANAAAVPEPFFESAETVTIPAKNAQVPAYSYSVEWVNGWSEDVKDYHYENGRLVFHPTENVEQTATLKLSIVIQGDSTQSLPAGSVSFIVPKTVFESWEGDGNVWWDGTGSPRPKITWQIPEAPATSASSNFNYTVNENGDYVLTNFDALNGGRTFSVEIAYQFLPTLVKGGYTESGEYGKANAVYAGDYMDQRIVIPFSMDADLDGTPEVTEEKSLDIEVHTNVPETDVKKQDTAGDKNGGVFFTWDPAWGKEPDNAEDYFYLVWNVDIRRSTKSTQPYNFDLIENETLLGKYGAKIVGARFRGYGLSELQKYKSYTDIAADGWEECLSDRTSIVPGSMLGKGNVDYADYFSAYDRGQHYWARYDVVIAYPRTLLSEAEKAGTDLDRDGLSIENTVTFRENWLGGYTRDIESGASRTVYVHPYKGGGATFDKWAPESYGYCNAIQRGQDYILEGKPVRLQYKGRSWDISSKAGPYTEPAWNAETGTYTAEPYTVEWTDGTFTLSTAAKNNNPAYARSSLTDPLVLEEGDYTFASLYIALTEYDGTYSGGWDKKESSDYDSYEPVEIWCGSGDALTLYGSITRGADGKYNFTSANGSVTQSNITSSNRLQLPENTYRIRVAQTSTHFESDLTVYLDGDLQPTERVKARVQKDKDAGYYGTYVTNDMTARYSARKADGTEYSADWDSTGEITPRVSYTLRPMELNTTLSKSQNTSLKDDTASAMQTRKVYLRVKNSYQNPGTASLESRKDFLFRKGIVYDLLPTGTSVDASTVSVCFETGSGNRNLARENYEVSFTDNWQGSGQTMMTVAFEIPDAFYEDWATNGTRKDPTLAYSDQLSIIYSLNDSYDNIQDRGSSVLNSAAFINLSDTRISPDKNNAVDKLEKAEYFEELAAEYEGSALFTQAGITYSPVSVLETGFQKKVAAGRGSFATSASGSTGCSITYQLKYTALDTTYSDSVVFYDVFTDETDPESGKTSEWNPVFERADVSSAAAKRSAADDSAYCDPVVYYATRRPTAGQMDIDAYPGIWSTAAPDDLSRVKAVAVDCRRDTRGNPFVLEKAGTVNIYLYMKAPADAANDGKTSVNLGSMSKRTGATKNIAGGTVSSDSYAWVSLKEPKVQLHKTSSPASGTAEAPAELSNGTAELNYTITVQNDSKNEDYLNVIVEDLIPEGLTIDPAGTTVSIYNAAGQHTYSGKISSRSDMVQRVSGQNVRIDIDTLKAGYRCVFNVSTTRSGSVVRTTDYVNTAEITSIEGCPKAIRSETTYHRTTALYTLTYHVVDVGGGLPSSSTTPPRVTGLEYEENVTLKTSTTEATTGIVDGRAVPGTWEFLGWHGTEDDAKTAFESNDPYAPLMASADGGNSLAPLTEVEILADMDVYGGYLFTPNTYTLTYHVAGDDTYGIPDDSVTPAAETDILWGGAVDPLANGPVTEWTTHNGKADGIPGTWVFPAYWSSDESYSDQLTKAEDITENRDMYGRWTFVPTTYGVTYVVNEDSAWGKPEDSVTPVDPVKYEYMAAVTVADELTSAQGWAAGADGVQVPGSWRFGPWDKDDFNITQDTVITGGWSFTPYTYGVTYVVEEDAAWGKPEDSASPVDPGVYDYLDPVTVADALTSAQDYAVDPVSGTLVPGTWVFTDWDRDDFRITENTTITGAWKFVPSTYSVTYTVNGDPEWGSPEEPAVPVDATAYSYLDPVTVADELTTVQNWAADANGMHVPGVWTFIAWDKDDFRITENTVITGSWKFEPYAYKVTYEVKGDETWGIPENSAAPIDKTAYHYMDGVTVADALTTGQDYAVEPETGDKVGGTWTFTPWDHDDFNITEDTVITGAWKFTPGTYRVKYVVVPDRTYGVPGDSLTPTDYTSYQYLDPVKVADPLTSVFEHSVVGGRKVYGTWKFIGWDRKDFVIKQDTVITGCWQFMPNIPKTGDNNPLLLWLALFAVSGGVLAGAAAYDKKRKPSK